MPLVPAFGLALGLVTVLPAAALASTMRVSEPTIIVAPVGQSATVLMQLENTGAEDDRLISAEAGDLAHGVSLHTHVADPDGTTRVVPATEGIRVPAGTVQILGRAGNHALGHQGDHAMFLDLARSPSPGEEITLTLRFESGADLSVRVPVAGHPTSR